MRSEPPIFSMPSSPQWPVWGTRFPNLMKKLYAGALVQSDASAALGELDEVRKELATLPVSKVIWDIDRGKTPPLGGNIADTITDLSNYFVTSTGRDVIATLRMSVSCELRLESAAASHDRVPLGRSTFIPHSKERLRRRCDRRRRIRHYLDDQSGN